MAGHRLKLLSVAAAVAVALLFDGSVASAHGTGAPHSPGEFVRAWPLDGPTILALLGMLASYRAGLSALSRGPRASPLLARRRVVAGHLGLLALALAVLSPIDALAGALFSAHMLQHMLILTVAAPLLAAARADTVAFAALPHSLRRRLRGASHGGAFWNQPLVVGLLFAATVWLWHLSGPYEAAERSGVVHAAEHASMFLVAFLWFRLAFQAAGTRRFGFPFALGWIATTMLQLTALSGLMAFSDHPWYATYAHAPGEWPIDAVTDQQLAGVIMWLFGTPLLLGITLTLIARWFRIEERRARHEVARSLRTHADATSASTPAPDRSSG